MNVPQRQIDLALRFLLVILLCVSGEVHAYEWTQALPEEECDKSICSVSCDRRLKSFPGNKHWFAILDEGDPVNHPPSAWIDSVLIGAAAWSGGPGAGGPQSIFTRLPPSGKTRGVRGYKFELRYLSTISTDHFDDLTWDPLDVASRPSYVSYVQFVDDSEFDVQFPEFANQPDKVAAVRRYYVPRDDNGNGVIDSGEGSCFAIGFKAIVNWDVLTAGGATPEDSPSSRPSGGYWFRHIMAHEFGHALGLDHPWRVVNSGDEFDTVMGQLLVSVNQSGQIWTTQTDHGSCRLLESGLCSNNHLATKSADPGYPNIGASDVDGLIYNLNYLPESGAGNPGFSVHFARHHRAPSWADREENTPKNSGYPLNTRFVTHVYRPSIWGRFADTDDYKDGPWHACPGDAIHTHLPGQTADILPHAPLLHTAAVTSQAASVDLFLRCTTPLYCSTATDEVLETQVLGTGVPIYDEDPFHLGSLFSYHMPLDAPQNTKYRLGVRLTPGANILDRWPEDNEVVSKELVTRLPDSHVECQ